MGDALVISDIDSSVAEVVLNDPGHRNAVGEAMFDALEAALERLAGADDVHVVILRGNGPAFCAGFDLTAAVERPELLESFILRLSRLGRTLRRLPPVVVASVHGAAIAGGCAILSACDFVVTAPDAKIGYPVHRLGISPAVSAPTLIPAIGAGAARALQLSGELIDGRRAHEIGLATHLAASAETVLDDARALARTLAGHGPRALRATKAWLNELDGSLDDDRFDPVARATGRDATGEEAVTLLRDFWLRSGRGDGTRRS
jgi:methylglutaconyl-CoA hydratase